MHVCNLGLFHVLNAEGLTILAEHRASRRGCTFRESLDHLYAEFRQFCTRNKIKCSQRRFKLHSVSAKGLPEYIVLITKAFNARVILGYVAVPFLHQALSLISPKICQTCFVSIVRVRHTVS